MYIYNIGEVYLLVAYLIGAVVKTNSLLGQLLRTVAGGDRAVPLGKIHDDPQVSTKPAYLLPERKPAAAEIAREGPEKINNLWQ